MAAVTKLDRAIGEATGLAERFRLVRATTERLASPLTPEDQMVQSCFEASPVKWHRAHTTWFFETFILAQYLPGYQPFDERFRWLFNSYYNNVGERPERTIRGLMSRPTALEVTCYREHVDGAMELLLEGLDSPHIAALIDLGLNHEQQHQELIVTDIKHALWINPLHPQYWPQCEAISSTFERNLAAVAGLQWRGFEGGIAAIGHTGSGFAFDNESPRHRVLLQDFSIATRLVTNSEYLEFIADGGYRTPTLWLSEGWDTVRLNNWRWPLYWEPVANRDGEWMIFTCSGMRSLDPNEPVCHVSYFEADAFARWRNARLATEFEWEYAAAKQPIQGNFMESDLLHPRAAGDDSTQFFGDCWEWTASAYTPYPGFRAAEGALGEYNAKFMCNQYVLRGGSCTTPRSHIRSSYRNFFPAQTRWQFSGIRLAKDGSRRLGAELPGVRNGS